VNVVSDENELYCNVEIPEHDLEDLDPSKVKSYILSLMHSIYNSKMAASGQLDKEWAE
jgi:hypothetical protein